MIYCLGLYAELSLIRERLNSGFDVGFKEISDANAITPDEADLLLIGPRVKNPVKYAQQAAANDKLLSIIIFTEREQFAKLKHSLQFSPFIGKNTSCIIYNPSTNYTTVFTHAITKTRQKRRFKNFDKAVETKLAQFTSASVKLENLGEILEHVPIGAVLIDSNLNVNGANKSARQMFRHLHTTTVSLSSLFSQDVIDNIKSSLARSNPHVINAEDLNRNSYEIIASKITSESGHRYLLLISDVTESKESQRRVETILEALPQIAWTANTEGKINYFTKGWYAYTNRLDSESMGDAWAASVHPDDLKILKARWEECINNVTRFEQAARYRKFDGSYRWHLARAVPIYSKLKTVEMWVGTTTDIHDQVMRSEELERKVQERTEELEERNAELEQFAYISSHDLQEPLRKIQTFANIVRDGAADALDSNLSSYVDKIISTSRRMSKLLKDLLSFTKINQAERAVKVNLNSIVDQLKDDLELVIQQTQANIQVEHLPVITARPLQIKQLFYNLLSNGLKFRKPGVRPLITITCAELSRKTQKELSRLDPTRKFWEFIVRDNGIGFDQKYAEQIFTVFQRLHSRSAYDGTGIGLAIAKKVVTSHGGDIFAFSSIDEGSEFHIVLPATETDEQH